MHFQFAAASFVCKPLVGFYMSEKILPCFSFIRFLLDCWKFKEKLSYLHGISILSNDVGII